MKQENTGEYASENQLLLARLYRAVALIGFSIIAIAFVLYLSGALKVSIGAIEVTSYWHLSAEEYAAETATPYGWEIISGLENGDTLSLASLVFMPVAVIVCLLIMAFAFARKRDWPYFVMVVLQVGVLVIAASGVVAGK
jgi:hypothetical protein